MHEQDGGSLKCWGYNSNGQMGDGTSGNWKITPVAPQGSGTESRVAQTPIDACALAPDFYHQVSG